MAQASAHLTTRRGFSKIVAGLAGAFSTLPSVAFATPKADWRGYELRLYAVYAEIEGAKNGVAQARDALRRWEKKNPYPDTVEGDPVWNRRYVQAIKDSGLRHHNKLSKSLRQQRVDICDEVAAEKAVTAQDFDWKWRLSRFDFADGAIIQSIQRDTLDI